MSIATKTGDQGTTGLMYNRRVAKTHPRVEAYGTVDELNSAIGLARAHAASAHPHIATSLLAIQKQLVILMGELATAREDQERYVKDGYHLVTEEMVVPLDAQVVAIEARKISFRGWATPGDTVVSAALDVARTTARRAERRVTGLQETGEFANPQVIVYLNRLSDLLWLMARWTESGNQGEYPSQATHP